MIGMDHPTNGLKAKTSKKKRKNYLRIDYRKGMTRIVSGKRKNITK